MNRYWHIPLAAFAWLPLVLLLGARWQPVGAAQLAFDELWATLPAHSGSQPPLRGPSRVFQLNQAALKRLLGSAPIVSAANSSIALPLPDGSLAWFRFQEIQVLPPSLAQRFPQIRTFAGHGIDDPNASVRFECTPVGVHAQIRSPAGTIYINPLEPGRSQLHSSYGKRDHLHKAGDFACHTAAPAPALSLTARTSPELSETTLRTYRFACAATAEFTAYHGGTVELALAAIASTVNRINGIFESELGIRLTLIPDNDLLIYSNSFTDPYSNGNEITMQFQNQTNLDLMIGDANYDIGHVFATAGGGQAGIGVVCIPGAKALGVTGVPEPDGDPFWVDYVAHEIGHQFGASHTFNSAAAGCIGRDSDTAYEPGSGSTIMAYAGVCGGDNLQLHSDPYFHSASIEQILAFVAGQGGACVVTEPTGNIAPSVDAGPDYVIPRGTPFTLTALATDPDGDLLTFCWEQRDLGPAIPVNSPDNGLSPLFRSFAPGPDSPRTFPRLVALLGEDPGLGEKLPVLGRTMHFCVTARDNRPSGGGLAADQVQVTVVSNAGPFTITSPNTAVVWSSVQTITWNVAGTTNPPINSLAVNILLSTNSGHSFPITLAAHTPNDGSETVILPSLACAAAARVRIEPVDNIYFDVSDLNFTLLPYVPAPDIVLDSVALQSENCSPGNGLIDAGESVLVRFTFRNAGSAPVTNLIATLLSTNGVILPSPPQFLGLLPTGTNSAQARFAFTTAEICGGWITAVLQLSDGDVPLGAASHSFLLGTNGVILTTASNTAGLAILDNQPAAPYPSTIEITGNSGTITKTTVTLHGFSHTYPDDVDVLLVGPGGQAVLLMSDAGGNPDVSDVSLVFDDDVFDFLPDNTQLSSGTNLPGNFDLNSDSFPAPAPPGPFGQSLNVFRGLSPNGSWSLFVRDDGNRDTGALAGWSLSITTSNPICCPGPLLADLAITASPTPTVNTGEVLIYDLTLTNQGPADALGVVVTSALGSGLHVMDAFASQGEWVLDSQNVDFQLGLLTNGTVASLTVSAIALGEGILTNHVSVSSSTTELAPENNQFVLLSHINAFPQLLGFTNLLIPEDPGPVTIPFAVLDAETSVANLTLTVLAADTNLFPEGSLTLDGTNKDRTLTLEPAPNQFGTTTVNVAVSDGLATTTSQFIVGVCSVNDAPVLAVIPDQVVFEHGLLTVSNSAVDADPVADNLLFAFSGPAPEGMKINPTNGLIEWMPGEEDGPGTKLVTVQVSDDGLPSLTAAQSFTVVVLETNSPPALATAAQIVLHAGSLVRFQVSGSDPDLPANILTFSLGAPAPAGASLNVINGEFTWQTSDLNASTTNQVLIGVVDDGFPPLSTVTPVSIAILPRPSLEHVTATDGTALLAWRAIPGQIYRVQHETVLGSTNWVDLTPDLQALDSVLLLTNQTASAQGFYRLILRP